MSKKHSLRSPKALWVTSSVHILFELDGRNRKLGSLLLSFSGKIILCSGWLIHYTQGNKQWAMTQIDREHFIALTNCPTVWEALRNTKVFIK